MKEELAAGVDGVTRIGSEFPLPPFDVRLALESREGVNLRVPCLQELDERAHVPPIEFQRHAAEARPSCLEVAIKDFPAGVFHWRICR